MFLSTRFPINEHHLTPSLLGRRRKFLPKIRPPMCCTFPSVPSLGFFPVDQRSLSSSTISRHLSHLFYCMHKTENREYCAGRGTNMPSYLIALFPKNVLKFIRRNIPKNAANTLLFTMETSRKTSLSADIRRVFLRVFYNLVHFIPPPKYNSVCFIESSHGNT